MKIKKSICSVLLLMSLALLLASCGGGGGGSSSASSPADSAAPAAVEYSTITGSVFAAPVSGARVSVRDRLGNLVAGPVMTGVDGSYRLEVPSAMLRDDLRFDSADGTFTDEATGLITQAGAMAAYISGGTVGSGGAVHLDPSSTIIHNIVVKYSKTPAEARDMFNSAFGYIPDTSVGPKNESSSAATPAERLAALRAAAFSKLTKDLNLSPAAQFELLSAIAQDISDDGKLNGSSGAVSGTNLSADILNKFEQALITIMADVNANRTGITPDDLGNLPFGKVILTNTYRFEYIPGMAAAAQGKSRFKVKITKRSDGQPAAGLTVGLFPLMHMSTMNHSTPFDAPVEDSANPGTYNFTVYYLMASGPKMGFWELRVQAGGETAVFYPQVGMPMGKSSVRATLKGQADTIAPASTKRTYYLFNDMVTTATGFNLFIAAQEGMMSYPAVYAGTRLHDASAAEWTVNTMTVEVSTDRQNWVQAVDNTGGHWSATGLTGLTSGQQGTIYVRLTVNGEQKTADGAAVTDTNSTAVFTVVP